jgi:hypothetical protein
MKMSDRRDGAPVDDILAAGDRGGAIRGEDGDQMASPMPRVPPVTSARLPVNSGSENVLIGVSPLERPLAAELLHIWTCCYITSLTATREVSIFSSAGAGDAEIFPHHSLNTAHLLPEFRQHG